MNTTQKPRQHLTETLAGQLRELARSEAYAPGGFLPPERELVRQYGVSRVTVRRALGRLVSEGLLEAVPSQGYRPRHLHPNGKLGGPVAYVLAQAGEDDAWDDSHAQILQAFQHVLLPQGEQVLALGAKERSGTELAAAAREAGAWGVALDSSRDDLAEAFAAARMPCVIVDAYNEHPDMDVILQDNLNGARKASEWLASRGKRRIAWLGPTRGFVHYRERFAGACMGLRDAELQLPDEMIFDARAHNDVSRAEALLREAFARPADRRPDGLICLWQPMALAAARVLDEMDLTGAVELVAWATEKEYRDSWAPRFLGGRVPATLVWRPADLAALAIERLRVRAKHRDGPAARCNAQVTLREPQSADRVVRGA